MTRSGSLKLGAALVLLGVVLTVTSLQSDRGGVIFYGLIAVGAFRILRALGAGPDPELRDGGSQVRPPPRDDPRWHISEGRQIVGQSCADCSARFVTADEAIDCPHCDELLHDGACLARHLANRHGPAAPKPYR